MDARSLESIQPASSADAATLLQSCPHGNDCSKDGPSVIASAAVLPAWNDEVTPATDQHPGNTTAVQTVRGVTLREDGLFRLCEASPLVHSGVNSETPCPICLDPLRSNAWRRLSCTHCYHETCLLKWTEAATNLQCPTCRFDLEASALAEFESDFAVFKQEVNALAEGDGEDPKRILTVVVTEEHCRRRLFDAALARRFKLHAQVRMTDEFAAVGIFPETLEVLLDQLHMAHQVLETRCTCEMSQLNSDIDAELLTLLCEQLFYIHILLKHVCKDPWCITHHLSRDLQKHINHVRRICELFLKLCRKMM